MGFAQGSGFPHPIPAPTLNPISALLVQGQVPLADPPATQSNVQGFTPVNAAARSRFSTYAQATAMLPLCQAAVAAIPDVKPGFTLAIVDACGDFEEPYALNNPVSNPPAPGDPGVTCWHIEGLITIGNDPATNFNESVGDLLVRSVHPTTEDFSPSGWGGPNLRVSVLNEGGTDVVQAYWGN
jgi:hypothetical protein